MKDSEHDEVLRRLVQYAEEEEKQARMKGGPKREFFWRLYERLAETGVCDSPGGYEFAQVYADWLEAGAEESTAEQFIREHANASGWIDGRTGIPLPAEAVLGQSKRSKLKARRDGQIIPKGDKRWLVRVFLGNHADGRKKYKSEVVHGPRKAAQAKLNEILRSRDTGDYTEPSKVTLNEYLDRWLRDGTGNCTPRSIEGYRWLLEKHVRPVIGDARLDRLQPLDVQQVISAMVAKEYAPRTVRMAHAALRVALQQAIRWRLINRNPARDVQLPKNAPREMRSLTAAEVAKLRTAVVDLRDASLAKAAEVRERSPYLADRAEGEAARWARASVFFDLALTSGLRPGELLGLRWSDVDLTAGRLTIQQALTWVPEPSKKPKAKGPKLVPTFSTPKTASSRRTIPVGPVLVKSLTAHRKAQAELILKAGALYDRSLDLVFANEVGGPLDERNVAQRDLAPALAKAKIEDRVRLYDLRHSCASLLLASGTSVKTVAERLGHASAKMTLDVYAHVLPGEQEKATEKIEGALLGS